MRRIFYVSYLILHLNNDSKLLCIYSIGTKLMRSVAWFMYLKLVAFVYACAEGWPKRSIVARLFDKKIK